MDLETLEYSNREYHDLMHRYRDAHGFVVSLQDDEFSLRQDGLRVTKSGRPTDQGDAVIFTGLAAVVAAQRGEVDDVKSLLVTLRDKPFVYEAGRTRLIRHPEVWDYVRNEAGEFVRERHAPLTKDGLVGVNSAILQQSV